MVDAAIRIIDEILTIFKELPELLEKMHVVGSKVDELVNCAIETIDFLSHDQIELKYVAKQLCTDVKMVTNDAEKYIDKVHLIFFYGQHREWRMKVKKGMDNGKLRPLQEFINLLERCLAQAEQSYIEFEVSCKQAEESSVSAAEKCNHKAQEASSKKIATKAIGGTVAGGVMAAGIAGGVTASVIAGFFTFGIGTVVGLSLTAAGSVAGGAAIGTTTAVVTHCVASKFEKTEGKLRKVGRDFDAIYDIATDIHIKASYLHDKVLELGQLLDDVNVSLRQRSQDSIGVQLELLFQRFDSFYQQSSLSLSSIKNAKEKIERVQSDIN